MTTDFLGPFADDFRRFVAHKRALGRHYHTELKTLQLFDRYLTHHGIIDRTEVTPDLVEVFLISRPRVAPRSYNHLLGVLGRCFAWLVVQGLLESSPVLSRPRRATRQRVPFLFARAKLADCCKLQQHFPITHGQCCVVPHTG
jgi:site-specific recombinase XerD